MVSVAPIAIQEAEYGVRMRGEMIPKAKCDGKCVRPIYSGKGCMQRLGDHKPAVDPQGAVVRHANVAPQTATNRWTALPEGRRGGTALTGFHAAARPGSA